MDKLNNLYREEILEHYRNPQNFGKLDLYDTSSKQLNPFCGDEIEMFVKCELISAGVDMKSPRGCRIIDISFFGKGCAISIAAASILTDYVKGKTKSQLTKFLEKDMLDLLGVNISETRKKCALLALAVLKDCIK